MHGDERRGSEERGIIVYSDGNIEGGAMKERGRKRLIITRLAQWWHGHLDFAKSGSDMIELHVSCL